MDEGKLISQDAPDGAVSKASVITDYQWMPWQLGHSGVQFRFTPLRAITEATFLDDRLGSSEKPLATMKFEDFWSSVNKGSVMPMGHLFHISHVGSTFMARLLNEFHEVLTLREPRIFRDFSALVPKVQSGQGFLTGARFEKSLGAVGDLLRRTPPGRNSVIIKHTSGNLALAPHLVRDNEVAIILTTSLENFIAHATHSKGLQADAISNAERRLEFVNSLCEIDQIRLPGLQLPKIVAVNWLCETVRAERFASSRPHTRIINFDDVKSDAEHLATVLSNLAGGAQIELLKESQWWEQSSKSGAKFTWKDRDDNLSQAKKMHAKMISETRDWISRLITRNPSLYVDLEQFKG